MADCRCHSHDGFLTDHGLSGIAQRELGLYGLDAMAPLRYLDKVGSVSGLRRDEDLYANILDSDIDEQSRRFHHGS